LIGFWIVLTTHPHREDFAIENPVRQDYEAYCPMIVKRIKPRTPGL
jgi:transcriptional antiterminator RfaH